MRSPRATVTRRNFLARNLAGLGLVLVQTPWIKIRGEPNQAKGPLPANPFGYEIDSFAHTDPKLLSHDLAKTVTGIAPQARRIRLGPDKTILIAAKPGIQVLDREGREEKLFRTSTPARCLAVARDGTVYGGSRTRIEVFAPDGKVMNSWEVPGAKTWLTGLALTESHLFVADSGNRLIWKYDRLGKLLKQIGVKDSQRNIPGLIVPSPYLDVELGLEGLLWVNNPGRHRVDVYTQDGELEFWWGKASASIEGFCGCCNPVGLAPLAGGRCVTCEKGLPRVKIYSPERSLESVVAGPEFFNQNGPARRLEEADDGTSGALDVAADATGNIYILETAAARVSVMRPKG